MHTLAKQQLQNNQGLNPKASSTQIKARYYQLAKQWHPDQNKSSESTSKFAVINQAYEILMDQNRRKVYDSEYEFKSDEDQIYRYKSKKYTQRNTRRQQSDPFNQQDSFFNNSFYKIKRSKRGEDIYDRVNITLLQAFRGIKKIVYVLKKLICKQCLQTKSQKCFTCGGKGKNFIKNTKGLEECQKCQGRGFKHNCHRCKGEGYIYEKCEEQIIIKKGITNNTILRKQKRGSQGFHHNNGDLYIKVFIDEHPIYKVDGINVRSICYLPISKAVLGGKITINTLHGQLDVNIEAGTQSGEQKRLPNFGLPSFYSKQMGDHILQFKIAIPKNIQSEYAKVFENLSVVQN